MSLQLYDTATRSVRDFVPREPGKAGIYLCGVTVQSPPHIGHLRSGVNYDVLRRWLEYRGLAVRFIRNITDIDDKVLKRALDEGVPYWSIAYRNERLLDDAYDAVGVELPTYEPRATGHIPEMHELIQRLIDRGHAYVTDAGEVYFDVSSWPEYGALSGQKPDEMRRQSSEPPAPDKRNPLDFALWKGVKPTEPQDAYWPSPWGRGRPGWHIECSAMTWRYLGEEFDIHGGGRDIQFPHHENEVAQSKAAGFGFARFWVHNGPLNMAGEKMSKSIGNVVGLPELAAHGIRPAELRYYLAAPHYRSVIDFSYEALEESAAAYRRVEGFVQRAVEQVGVVDPGPVCADFVTAMDDDLNTPRAFAALHEVVRDGNAALASGDRTAVAGALAGVRGMLGLLGLDPLSTLWREAASDDLRSTVDKLVAHALERREQARAGRDWSTADAVRDQLKQAGVLIEDTPHGPRWTLADDTTDGSS
ncbi:cysteine--tRNA ligase [Actinocatenispora rupis]|uniref:Cysteine--tRNA ligase n=1 Tax=Actinocatenispora rupis TaxID=519421 RepID=A0A8J3JAZ3_9ACTN|nr:cysteine--tRNA ligase [Actinocatenispora rupis]GID15115.1 cysteine--tRNA ligase [Actinocatenispora rupis]